MSVPVRAVHLCTRSVAATVPVLCITRREKNREGGRVWASADGDGLSEGSERERELAI
jgi:hypothetical protein